MISARQMFGEIVLARMLADSILDTPAFPHLRCRSIMFEGVHVMTRFQVAAAAACLVFPFQAIASFHFMQIEQAIGGVDGDSSQQAVQLRLRFGGQNEVGGTRIVAYDAAGLSPVELIVFPSDVTNGAGGARILVASPDFELDPDIAPDAVMTSTIPASYLAAGRLTFQFGDTVYWSLCWGGDDYTGPTTGSTTNDADGEFGPCVAGPLPSADDLSLLFQGEASAPSTNNAGDYSLSVGPAVFTNNAGLSGMIPEPPIFVDGFESPP